MSHTSKVKVQFHKNIEALTKAVLNLGGSILGSGSHKLYSETVDGFGFKLPNWNYPLIINSEGELKYDNYNGSWGNTKDIDKLTAEYTFGAAKQVAEEQGWMYTQNDDNLIIDIPGDKQVIMYNDGSHEAMGFEGQECMEVGDLLNKAIGEVEELNYRPEYFHENAHVTQLEN